MKKIYFVLAVLLCAVMVWTVPVGAEDAPSGGGSSSGGSADFSELLEDALEAQAFVAETTATNELIELGGMAALCNVILLSEEQYEQWHQNRNHVIVRYDGVKYVLDPQLIDPFGSGETGVGVGNLEAFGGTGNGEPFSMAAMYEYTGDRTDYFILCASMVDTAPTEHTVAIDLQVATQKLKKTYIPDNISVSWDNVTDKPFGEETATIFEGTFQDTLKDTDGDGVNDAWNGEMMIEDASDAALIVGETYTYTWEGVEYTSGCFMFDGLPIIGNTIVAGGEDNGQPVSIIRDSAGLISGSPVWLAALVEIPIDLTISGAYACRILGAVTKCLDNKYLDFIEGEYSTETDIFEEQTVDGFAPDNANDTESPYLAALINFTGVFVIGETYRVVWDDVEYEFVARNYYGIGGLGDLETSDPFGMVATGDRLIVQTTDKTVTSHKIRIIRQATTPKIKEECIPAIPEFDLIAMGLPTVPIDGSLATVSGLDLTEMKNAIAKGLAKIKINIDGIVIKNITAFASVGGGGDSYTWGGMFVYSTIPVVINVNVFGDTITAQAIPLAAEV